MGDIAGGPGDAKDDCSLLDTEVQAALREELEKDNCIRELEVRFLFSQSVSFEKQYIYLSSSGLVLLSVKANIHSTWKFSMKFWL